MKKLLITLLVFSVNTSPYWLYYIWFKTYEHFTDGYKYLFIYTYILINGLVFGYILYKYGGVGGENDAL